MKLELIVPQKEDLWFKKEMKEDPSTMDYNAGYDLNIDGYNRQNGTIQTDINELKEVWAKKWIGNRPAIFYYFIQANKQFIGEIYAKYDVSRNSYEIGIVIKGEYRGKGYSTPAIKLLCEELKKQGIKKIVSQTSYVSKSSNKSRYKQWFYYKKRKFRWNEKIWGK